MPSQQAKRLMKKIKARELDQKMEERTFIDLSSIHERYLRCPYRRRLISTHGDATSNSLLCSLHEKPGYKPLVKRLYIGFYGRVQKF